MHIPLRPFLLLMLLGSVAQAQTVTPQAQGGPASDRVQAIGRDAGPANQPPHTDGPQAVNRGTDGSAAGLEAPAATGTTPQGMLGEATAGARRPTEDRGPTPEPLQSAPPPGPAAP